jgi:ATP-dependent DNA helicase RecQ
MERDPILHAARTIFGHETLRPGQREAVEALMKGHDVLLVQPTGGGKSLAYQLPAVLLERPTLVVSPLLALQEDQTRRLDQHGHRTVARRISSAETKTERDQALADAAAGQVEFLFLAPEQLANDDVRAAVTAMRPTLIAVDEAHCVSSWGHDFRPDYLRLGELLAGLDGARLIAMTATAAPPVRKDILERLGMRDAAVVVGGTARENIYLAVHRCIEESEQRARVIEAALSSEGPGIIYVATRKTAEQLAATLAERGLEAAAYHAGMRRNDREQVQRDFMAGSVDVMVATSAFGMGIDKPDIRYVFHAQTPESPDEYYQQVGRAGRDGEPALGICFYRPEDFGLARFFNASIPKAEQVAAVQRALAEHPKAPRKELAERSGLGVRALGRILNLITECATEGGRPDVEQVVARAEAYRSIQRSRIERMRAYAETLACRRQYLLRYFGEADPDPCGECDNCHAGTGPEEDVVRGPFAVEQAVRHDAFGDGVVMSTDGDTVTVLFEDVGYRTLSVPAVVDQQLLLTRE